jgi:hypothetical protein
VQLADCEIALDHQLCTEIERSGNDELVDDASGDFDLSCSGLNFAIPSELLMCGEAGREEKFDLSLLRRDRRHWCPRGHRWM